LVKDREDGIAFDEDEGAGVPQFSRALALLPDYRKHAPIWGVPQHPPVLIITHVHVVLRITRQEREPTEREAVRLFQNG
jgi:hypothetical protein